MRFIRLKVMFLLSNLIYSFLNMTKQNKTNASEAQIERVNLSFGIS